MKKNLKQEILIFAYRIVAWFLFGNVAIYAATRVINFFNNPYMEGFGGSGYYRDYIFTMMLQTIGFMIIFGLVISAYKLFLKKEEIEWQRDIHKWQTWLVFSVTFIFVVLGIFLS